MPRSGPALALSLLLGLCLAQTAQASSPWLAEKGQLVVTPVLSYEAFDEFYRGEARTDFPLGTYEQMTAMLYGQYGVTDWLNFDLALGFAPVFGDVDAGNGLHDVSLGVQLRLLDELAFDRPWIPSASLRVGGIIAGTYDAAGDLFPAIPGDKASGGEAELRLGRVLPWDVALTGAVGLRVREKEVPLEWHLRAGVSKTLWQRLTVSFAYDQWEATSGIDIGDPDFANRFRELREISRNVEAGLGYTDGGGRHYGFHFARTVDGRNTGIKNVYGFTVTAPFSLLGGR